ncbi:MAG: formylglycine-generating enzyme family protein [Candidatus Hydrogenedentes bacterium]|nr:formylglycine-generating enzyme family protein [Candidatus Hydrogenedentota bacterium]
MRTLFRLPRRARGAVLVAALAFFPAAIPAQETAPAPGAAETFEDISFVWCPAGTFLQGGELTPQETVTLVRGREEWYADEHPAHEVTLGEGFWISRMEITRAQWSKVMGSRPWGGEADADQTQDLVLPATHVSWKDANLFVAALNKLGRGTFSLPTEAQWEYACRAGTTTPYFFGQDAAAMGDFAWYRENTQAVKEMWPHQVASKQANAWGIYDLLGNVEEWCLDFYAPYAGAAGTDPAGPERGDYAVVRGGAYHTFPAYLRSASRSSLRTDVAREYTGFRIVRRRS